MSLEDVENVLETVKEMELIDIHLLIEGVNDRRDVIQKENRKKMSVGDTVAFLTRLNGKKNSPQIKCCGTITKKGTRYAYLDDVSEVVSGKKTGRNYRVSFVDLEKVPESDRQPG